jgi:hypothetical protein
MKLTVDQKTLCAVKHCQSNCACQAEGGSPRCRLSEIVDNKVFFTEGRGPGNCKYKQAFGSAGMCLCPVRQEIYRKHKV